VGALLFEALVGSAPFIGSVADVLRMKTAVAPPLASAHAPGLPADLDALCSALLQRAADSRPTGAEILRLLGASRGDRPDPAPRPAIDTGGALRLVGRREPLGALRDAFDASRAGRSITVNVRGPSGMGKSSLVQEFLDQLRVQFIRGIAYYARGRCAVASIEGEPARRRARVAEARRSADRLARERMPWTTALGSLVLAAAENAAESGPRAGHGRAEGDRGATIAALERAVAASDAAGMAMHAAAARFRLGQRLGGPAGEELAEAAAAAIAAQGIRSVPCWVAVYLPGDWTSGRK
jgi:hypothetical protein